MHKSCGDLGVVVRAGQNNAGTFVKLVHYPLSKYVDFFACTHTQIMAQRRILDLSDQFRQ